MPSLSDNYYTYGRKYSIVELERFPAILMFMHVEVFPLNFTSGRDVLAFQFAVSTRFIKYF